MFSAKMIGDTFWSENGVRLSQQLSRVPSSDLRYIPRAVNPQSRLYCTYSYMYSTYKIYPRVYISA